MPFLNYESLSQCYDLSTGMTTMSKIRYYDSSPRCYDTGAMLENIAKLRYFDPFHCLLEGNEKRLNAVKKKVSGLPPDFLKWLNACDGGMLFDTTLLSTKPYIEELGLHLGAYSFYIKPEVRNSLNLSNDWFVFAVAIHSDIYFFDLAKSDNKVYQWDIEDKKTYTHWDSFEDWISDQINEAISLIAIEKLMPYSIKLGRNE